MAAMTDSDAESIEHHAGRPLDATRDDALRAAALELLADIGYDRLTIDKIAAHAGAGKATIYRRWSGKADLVVDALMCQKAIPSPPDTGTLRGDFAALIDQADEQDGRLDAEVMIGLVSALPHDAELRDVFREQFIEPHARTLLTVVDRAVARGEIAPLEQPEMIVAVLPALVMHQLLTTGEPPNREFFTAALDNVVLPLLGVRSVASSDTELEKEI
ncbi:MAG TPA: TetR/AcrR family transcriptional regulator [Acidimicrobiales bacterium]|nr:TetR/AcrR family transcriptional regulator [Acidimicrobiales bacterium]